MSSEEIAPIVPAVDEALIPPLSLDALPPEVLNMILTSLDMPSSAVGRVACVSQSLRVTVGSLPFWKDVRVIGGLHELNAAVSEVRKTRETRRQCGRGLARAASTMCLIKESLPRASPTSLPRPDR